MQPTIGIDFLGKNITYKGKNYRLQLWDTAGQERFRSLIPSYLKDAICVIYVFDLSRMILLTQSLKPLKI
jgi:small GTP-binding protein